jgi:flavin-dependent dehydrogenase
MALKVLVVGGGIGGLTAAVGLRKQGHEVIVRFSRKNQATLLIEVERSLRSRPWPKKPAPRSTWPLMRTVFFDDWEFTLKNTAQISCLVYDAMLNVT